MSLIQNLKPRPLDRNQGALRDDRLFIVACDDTYAPQQYFGFFRLHRVQVHVVPTPANNNRCHASDVLQRLEQVDFKPEDERWLLLDTDHYIGSKHIRSFIRAIKDAENKGISVALSRPCFELWLLLHHADIATATALDDAASVERCLRDMLGAYNKTNLKAEHFSGAGVVSACRQAKALDAGITGGIIPKGNTTRVYQLWAAIIRDMQRWQLPEELADLADI